MRHRPNQCSRLRRWLLTGGMGAALIAVPLTSGSDPFSIVWHTALATNDGNHHRGQGRNEGAPGLDRPVGEQAHRFSPQETRQRIERDWRPARAASGFKNHGGRVRPMIKISKRLGHGARVGAMQAGCGAARGTGIARLETEPAEVRAEPEAGPEDVEAGARVDSLGWP